MMGSSTRRDPEIRRGHPTGNGGCRSSSPCRRRQSACKWQQSSCTWGRSRPEDRQSERGRMKTGGKGPLQESPDHVPIAGP